MTDRQIILGLRKTGMTCGQIATLTEIKLEDVLAVVRQSRSG